MGEVDVEVGADVRAGLVAVVVIVRVAVVTVEPFAGEVTVGVRDATVSTVNVAVADCAVPTLRRTLGVLAALCAPLGALAVTASAQAAGTPPATTSITTGGTALSTGER